MAVLIHKRRWTYKPPLGTQIDWSHPIAPGLVGCYLFNEGGGVISNLVNQSPATVSGTPTWITGDRGLAQNFAGSPARYDCGNALIFQDWTAFTYEVWANRRNSASNGQFITSKGDDCAGLTEVITGAWVIQFYLRTGVATYPTLNGAIVINPDEWHHRVALWDGSNMRLFIDAVQDGSDVAASGSLYQQNNFGLGIAFGAHDTSRQHWLGDIGIVRVWNRALSSVEIGQLYDQPHAMFVPPVRRLWLGPPAALPGGTTITHRLLPMTGVG